MTLDISKGIDPIPVYSDIKNDNYTCFVDGTRYTFDRLPFTLKEIKKPGRSLTDHCADKALILKHADKARAKVVWTLENVNA